MENILNEVIKIKVETGYVEGDLNIPLNPVGLIIFAHGSGSSRHSPRNKFVANQMNNKKFATLLFDLLTNQEDEDYLNRFNIQLLAERLIKATDNMKNYKIMEGLNIGYFGASTGAAAAIIASVIVGDEIKAVVSRGGRPDMADIYLDKLKAPTLLIVGEADTEVIKLNQNAYDNINSTKKLAIVPFATHLFEEPGTLEEAAQLAADWFIKYIA
jgi:pimeloyl-ACP methyl ester carboxylesterase